MKDNTTLPVHPLKTLTKEDVEKVIKKMKSINALNDKLEVRHEPFPARNYFDAIRFTKPIIMPIKINIDMSMI